jgi:alkanesulfonate monooxygenase SsuD/methylene tetrahydromethanopterin reductase-like flavin-dependent oxidoreductase (luciferase family)
MLSGEEWLFPQPVREKTFEIPGIEEKGGFGMKIGLLLPHFGDHCTHERVFGQIRAIEEAGFNSVWVRDHLSFRPHEFEGKSSRFLEPFTTLSALGVLTKKIILGTSTIVTFRHPLVTSQLFGTLAYAARGRIIAGIGAGTPRAPFDAVGLPYEKRGKIVEELIQILRLTWSQDHASFHGEIYHFDDMTIDPRPPADTPIYYGGVTSASVRRTAQYCDGWLPQRMPFKILDPFVARLRALEGKYQRKTRIPISYFPLANIDQDSARAREQIGMERLVQNLATMIRDKKWEGITATEANLEGAIIVGSPQECVDQLGRCQERGFDEIVLDMRNTFFEWEAKVELVAAHILPHFHKG